MKKILFFYLFIVSITYSAFNVQAKAMYYDEANNLLAEQTVNTIDNFNVFNKFDKKVKGVSYIVVEFDTGADLTTVGFTEVEVQGVLGDAGYLIDQGSIPGSYEQCN